MSAKETLPPLRGELVSARRERAARLLAALHQEFPQTRVALHHESPFQLLIAVILSAQCTDERVNQVTPAMFAAYPDAASMADAPLEHLQQLVQPTGFFRQKAKHILAAAQRITDVYGGEVPRTLEELTTIPGAARKTANVVIASCFPDEANGIAVDTHVQRIARRMGLVRSWEPDRIEQDLLKLIERDEWIHVTHMLIDHGRATCRAPKARCDECPVAIARDCPSNGRWDARTPRAGR